MILKSAVECYLTFKCQVESCSSSTPGFLISKPNSRDLGRVVRRGRKKESLNIYRAENMLAVGIDLCTEWLLHS